MNVLADSALE